ncbi:MAG: hypothetical protein HY784_13595, partial [Chloroflexi bacterium]|nr:hypothetical protein [Chloroflexota bacterium]
MTTRTITLNLPESLYSRVEKAARHQHRSAEEILLTAVDNVLPRETELPAQLAQALEKLIFLNDQALRQAARSTFSADQSARLEFLTAASKTRPLSSEEQEELNTLIARYEYILLV